MRPTEASRGTEIIQRRLTPAVVAAVVILAAANWVLTPEEGTRWLFRMLFLPSLWLGLTLWHHHGLRSVRRRGMDEEPVTRYFRAALAMIILALGCKQLIHYGIEVWVEFGDHRADLEAERRIIGVASGAVFVIIGNALPKILTPLSMLPPDAATRQTAARRFIGTVWFAIGLTVVASYVVLPVDLAGVLLRWATFAALLVVLAGIVWMNAGPAGQER